MCVAVVPHGSAGGDLYVWGWNESGQLGLPSLALRTRQGQQRVKGSKYIFFLSNSALTLTSALTVTQLVCKQWEMAFLHNIT